MPQEGLAKGELMYLCATDGRFELNLFITDTSTIPSTIVQ